MTGSGTAVLDPARVAETFGDLPTLAPVAVEVLRLAEDERASIEDIAAVIGRDLALASQMLRVANSAVYGMGGRTTSLVRAACVLGLRTVKLLSLTFSVVTRPDQSDPDAMLIWRHTLATSAIARAVSSARDPRVADECFVVGLLGDLGRIALSADERYALAVRADGWLGEEAERDVVGCTSDEVTGEILTHWGLPGMLGDAVRHRTDPAGTHGLAARVARVLHVADAAAHLVIAEAEDAGEALERYRRSAATYLELTEEETDQLLLDASPALDEIAAMFRADGPSDVPLDILLLRAKERLAQMSQEMVNALTEEQRRSEQLAAEVQRLAAEAATDSLTSLPNRRAFDQFMERTISARERRPQPGALGLLMIDLDWFKRVNDTYGHQTGDDVLRMVGATLALHTRRDEFAARIGGEEFVVVIPVTDPEEILLTAERFRRAIGDGELALPPSGVLRVTASIGAAWLQDFGDDAARRLYEAADGALHAAKVGGRDRVVLSPAR